MFKPAKVILTLLLGAMLAGATIARAAHAGEAIWRASKSSGEVWIIHSGAQPVALSNDGSVAPGDIVRTGQNGRVLLWRGEETMLVSAGSQVEIAPETAVGYSTILQKAGSILLEVEKRNVQHFEVQTPYLAAVVKGTKFSVTVEDGASSVEVMRGQVEVRNYRSGQIALVDPGQAATVAARDVGGISLSGPGALSPIQQGTPGGGPRQFVPPTNGSPTPPERRAEMAPGTRNPTEPEILSPASQDRSRATAKKMGTGSGDAFAGRERQSNNAIRNVNGGVSGAGDAEASDNALSGTIVRLVRVLFLGGHGTNQDEDNTATLAIPAFVGVAVALGIGVARRRKRIKRDNDQS